MSSLEKQQPVSFEQVFHQKVVSSYWNNAVDKGRDIIMTAFAGASRESFVDGGVPYALKPDDAYDKISWET
ncbi:MAG TPA: hypothetical protein V6C69_10470 [Trichormus sp.]|jgi:hypothetical protein